MFKGIVASEQGIKDTEAVAGLSATAVIDHQSTDKWADGILYFLLKWQMTS